MMTLLPLWSVEKGTAPTATFWKIKLHPCTVACAIEQCEVRVNMTQVNDKATRRLCVVSVRQALGEVLVNMCMPLRLPDVDQQPLHGQAWN